MKQPANRSLLLGIHRRLFSAFGPQHWWPGETPFEIMVGAILTQNTNWGNVERAVANLKAAGLLEPRRLAACPRARLARLIRPSGYYNIKAQRLHEFLAWLCARIEGDDALSLRRAPLPRLRHDLLQVRGIGPETADSILLYALGKSTFVVDAYTRRFMSRHDLISPNAGYAEIQELFQDSLPRSVRLYNEYHALIVRLGKEICRPRPLCAQCPLLDPLGPPRMTAK